MNPDDQPKFAEPGKHYFATRCANGCGNALLMGPMVPGVSLAGPGIIRMKCPACGTDGDYTTGQFELVQIDEPKPPLLKLMSEHLPEYYRRCFEILEQVFDKSWLENRRGEPGSKSRGSRHFLQNLWKDGQYAFGQIRKGSKDLSATGALHRLDDIAVAVEVASQLKNFDLCVLPRLKDKKRVDEFESALYEARIATIYARLGFEVRFEPTSDVQGKKTADLMVTEGGVLVLQL